MLEVVVDVVVVVAMVVDVVVTAATDQFALAVEALALVAYTSFDFHTFAHIHQGTLD